MFKDKMFGMKAFIIHRILILSALFIVLQQSGLSQAVISPEEFNPPDSDNRGKLTSTYKEFFKWKEYHLAQESWWNLFHEFPDNSEKLYVDGVIMYRYFIEESPEGQRQGRHD